VCGDVKRTALGFRVWVDVETRERPAEVPISVLM
jgi:hypothetical protein